MPSDGQCINGWGVYRKEPWDFVGLFPTRAEAERERENRAGGDYSVAFGSAAVGSNDFKIAEGSDERGS